MNDATAATELIQQAFGIARQSGKPDWWIMTIPVLKNRLLLLTNKSFREAEFGATSFRDLLRKLSDVVSLDESTVPGFVVLKSAASERADRPQTAARGDQLRPDLWRAMLDYSSGQTYVWDTSRQTARPARLDDDSPVLPTLSATDLDRWRAEFSASHPTTDVEAAKRIDEWCRNRLPTVALPPATRPAWNKYLKRRVERRLEDWFAENSIVAPPLIDEKQRGSTDEEVEVLRDFVLACVKTMSKQELQDLRISPVVAMRAMRTRKSECR